MRIISGESRGAVAAIARSGLALAESLYAAVIRRRNRAFDTAARSAVALPRPVISVGNITVGGTGKTPMVAWLCGQLRALGHRPAVLMRGYKAKPQEQGDEQRLLEAVLDGEVVIEANPNRVRGAQDLLSRGPDVDVFVLDDGFQHRQVRRDLDLVLIDATRPFGYGRLLPRGLLREPPDALARADAIIITRRSLVSEQELAQTRARIAAHASAPIFECDFASDGYMSASGRGLASLPGGRAVAVCGIGNPDAFVAALRSTGIEVARALAFGDHHAYKRADIDSIESAARQASAPVITTMKDWMKLQSLWPAASSAALYVAQQRVEFAPGDAQLFMQLVSTRINRSEAR